jgi:hypothetical protein
MGRFLDRWPADQATCGFGEGNTRGAFEQLKKDLDANPVTTANDGKANGCTLVYRLMFGHQRGQGHPALPR